MSGKLEGIFTPNVVPLADDGSINEPELRRYVDWLIASGVHGLYPNGSTGEFTRFTRRRAEADRGDRLPAGGRPRAGAGRSGRGECPRDACGPARPTPATGPGRWPSSRRSITSSVPRSVYAYFREIALNSPIDVTLYNIPMFASPIDVPTIRRLAEFPRIVGIKDSSGDMAFMMRMIAAVRPVRPDFTFLTGWEAVLVPMLLIGCDGGTNATSGVVPELTRKIYDLTRAGRSTRRCGCSTACWSCSTRCSTRPIFPRASARRWNCAASAWARSRQPKSEKQKVDFAALQDVLRCILAEFGFVDPPRRKAARRGPATWSRTASVRSPPWSCNNCVSGVPFERGARNLGGHRADADAGGAGRHGKGRRHPPDPV